RGASREVKGGAGCSVPGYSDGMSLAWRHSTAETRSPYPSTEQDRASGPAPPHFLPRRLLGGGSVPTWDVSTTFGEPIRPPAEAPAARHGSPPLTANARLC